MTQEDTSDDGEETTLDLDASMLGGGGDDDPEPPAAGAVTVDTNPGPDVSLAPTAEPNHVVSPSNAPAVA